MKEKLIQEILFLGGAITADELRTFLGTKKAYDYWVNKLQKEKFLWKFNRSIFTYGSDIDEAISNYMIYNNLEYYYGGLNIFNSLGLTTQIGQTIDVCNIKLGGLKKVNNFYINFIKIKPCFFPSKKYIINNKLNKERSIIEVLLYFNDYIYDRSNVLYFLQGLKDFNIDIDELRKYPISVIQKLLGLLAIIPGFNVDSILSQIKINNFDRLGYVNITDKKSLYDKCIQNTKTKTKFYY